MSGGEEFASVRAIFTYALILEIPGAFEEDLRAATAKSAAPLKAAAASDNLRTCAGSVQVKVSSGSVESFSISLGARWFGCLTAGSAAASCDETM